MLLSQMDPILRGLEKKVKKKTVVHIWVSKLSTWLQREISFKNIGFHFLHKYQLQHFFCQCHVISLRHAQQFLPNAHVSSKIFQKNFHLESSHNQWKEEVYRFHLHELSLRNYHLPKYWVWQIDIISADLAVWSTISELITLHNLSSVTIPWANFWLSNSITMLLRSP